jgi:NAD(P)-dependent dehydrogenase (short-subunit alcohol dehydrogenase family)
MKKWTAAEIPDQKGKTAVVTGANSGLGFHTALQLCRAGAHVVVTARDKGKGAAAIRRLRAEVPGADAEFGVVDLADLSSVRRFSAEILDRMRSLDVLVNNAGVMGVPQRLTTADGFELQFGTNHLGHFALTGLLLPALLARPGARVVTVSSLAHSQGRIRFDDIQGERVYDPWTAYAQSKLANLLFALELDRRARSHAVSLASVAAHPGVSATNLQTAGPRLGHSGFLTRGRLLLLRLIGQNAARGALPSVYAATAPEVVGGGFYGPAGPGQIRGDPIGVTPAPGALDQGVALRQWCCERAVSQISSLCIGRAVIVSWNERAPVFSQLAVRMVALTRRPRRFSAPASASKSWSRSGLPRTRTSMSPTGRDPGSPA